jgi:chromate transporter
MNAIRDSEKSDLTKTASGRHLGRLEMFMGFAEMGLCGFGGVATIARHVIVDRRRWMNEHDYAQLLGMGQILPGGNIINMTVMFGDRFHGPLGSVVALSGLMVMPMVILLALTLIYDAFSSNPDVRAATIGAGAAAAGLVIGMGLKMGRGLRLGPVHLGFAVMTFLAMGVLRLPFVATILVLAPLCVAATWWMRRE